MKSSSCLVRRAVVGIILIALLTSVFGVHAQASSSNSSRSAKRFGFYVSGNGDPAVSIAGISGAANITSFFRPHIGIGGVRSDVGQSIDIALYNTLIAPVPFALAWFFHRVFIMPFTSKISAPRFSNFRREYTRGQSVFAFGGGANLFVPTWDFSPTLGVNWAHITTSRHPYGLPDSASHVYYSGGFSWQTKPGIELGAGYNYCPRFDTSACGVYVNVGAFF